jgi:hypothetical protein
MALTPSATNNQFYISKHFIDHYVEIFLSDDTCIRAAPHQKFYLPQKNKWVAAAQLTRSDFLLGLQNALHPIINVVTIEKPAIMCALTVSTDHTYCITQHGIVVHNMEPISACACGYAAHIILPMAPIIGPAAAIPTIITGIVALTCMLLLDFAKNNNSKKKKQAVQKSNLAQNKSGGNQQQDPQDKEPKHPHGIYKYDATYHSKHKKELKEWHDHKTVKSPAPKDGQKALDNSVEIEGAGHRRIGISENEIVVLNQTSPGIFHGYVCDWKNLKH